MLIRYESFKQAKSVQLEQPSEIDAGIIDDYHNTVWKCESGVLYRGFGNIATGNIATAWEILQRRWKYCNWFSTSNFSLEILQPALETYFYLTFMVLLHIESMLCPLFTFSHLKIQYLACLSTKVSVSPQFSMCTNHFIQSKV